MQINGELHEMCSHSGGIKSANIMTAGTWADKQTSLTFHSCVAPHMVLQGNELLVKELEQGALKYYPKEVP